MTPPDWEQVRALMLAPKSPLVATVYAIGKHPANVALGAPDPGPAWAVAWVDPSQLGALAGATGEIVGSDSEGGRNRWVAEVAGLKGKTPVKVWIDAETGSIVRLERLDDPAPLVMVEGLRPA